MKGLITLNGKEAHRGVCWSRSPTGRPKKGHRRRPRKTQAGIMMQWDGSPHHWFGKGQPACCLMSSIDDAESKVLGALLVPAETSLGYLRLLDMVLRRHGAPLSVYQDRHSALVRTDDYWSREEQLQGEQYPTHVGRVLQDLGIEAISALSPQAKGRIERSFGIMQDRLIAELAYQGITDLEQANRWLEEQITRAVNSPGPERPFNKNWLPGLDAKAESFKNLCLWCILSNL